MVSKAPGVKATLSLHLTNMTAIITIIIIIFISLSLPLSFIISSRSSGLSVQGEARAAGVCAPAAPGGGAPSPPCTLGNHIPINREIIMQNISSPAAGRDAAPCFKALKQGSFVSLTRGVGAVANESIFDKLMREQSSGIK